MSDITISLEGLESVLASFAALPEQAARAERRAVNKVTKFVARGAKREVAKSMGVAQKILDDRIRSFNYGHRGIASGLVWFGLNPMAVTKQRFGSLTQTRIGAKAGRLSFPGAFVAEMKNGHVGVFRRRGKKRLPLDAERITLDTTAHRAILAAWAARAGERMTAVLSQELNYEVNVRGAK